MTGWGHGKKPVEKIQPSLPLPGVMAGKSPCRLKGNLSTVFDCHVRLQEGIAVFLNGLGYNYHPTHQFEDKNWAHDVRQWCKWNWGPWLHPNSWSTDPWTIGVEPFCGWKFCRLSLGMRGLEFCLAHWFISSLLYVRLKAKKNRRYVVQCCTSIAKGTHWPRYTARTLFLLPIQTLRLQSFLLRCALKTHVFWPQGRRDRLQRWRGVAIYLHGWFGWCRALGFLRKPEMFGSWDVLYIDDTATAAVPSGLSQSLPSQSGDLQHWSGESEKDVPQLVLSNLVPILLWYPLVRFPAWGVTECGIRRMHAVNGSDYTVDCFKCWLRPIPKTVWFDYKWSRIIMNPTMINDHDSDNQWYNYVYNCSYMIVTIIIAYT